jgi:hypothetical protein
MRKGSTSFGACEVRCWRWLLGIKTPVAWQADIHTVQNAKRAMQEQLDKNTAENSLLRLDAQRLRDLIKVCEREGERERLRVCVRAREREFFIDNPGLC